jgi:type IV pilus assembly protein PilX
MKLPSHARIGGRLGAQRGVVLFFALISLLAIMLAAVALVRSVDTSTIIAGNLAFKQSATSSGDAGTEAAIAWLTAVEAAENTKNVLSDTTHAFNIDNAAAGYYSSLNPNLSLTASSGLRIQWTDADSVLVLPDPDPDSGNSVRYVVQRMCRNANVAIQNADCLFSGALQDTNGKNIPLPQDICKGAGCPVAGQTPQIRITSRVSGPRNTISNVQAFVY